MSAFGDGEIPGSLRAATGAMAPISRLRMRFACFSSVARRHHARDGLRGIFGGLDCRRAFRHDYLQSQSDQLRGDPREQVLFALGKAVANCPLVAFSPRKGLRPIACR
jgi:hypothetical protein